MRTLLVWALALAFSACDTKDEAVVSGTTATATANAQTSGAEGSSTTGDLPSATCDPVLQDCDPGFKCTLVASDLTSCCVDTPTCVVNKGTQGEGQACTRVDGNDDCLAGLFCFVSPSNAEGRGTCKTVCAPELADSCPNFPEQACVRTKGENYGWCLPTCHPLQGTDACPTGHGCYGQPGKSRFLCLPGVAGVLPKVAHEPCEVVMDCAPGLTCVGPGLDSTCDHRCCTPYCDLTSEVSPCKAHEQCQPWFPNDAPPGLETLGLCVSPTQ